MNYVKLQRITLLYLTSLVIVIQCGCAVNPVTGKNELSLLSESQELAIGKQQYVPSQQIQGGQYRIDPELTEYVDRVGKRLAAVSDRPLPYEFVVLNNSVPNAWALPGGKIAINRGLLLELKNEAELAAVLAHEIVHAAARHGAQTMNRNIVAQGVMAAAAISTAGSEYSDYVLGAANLGAQLISHKYGRNAELESDYYGMHYMSRAGYNPQAAITLQETFVRLSKGKKTGWLEGLFASHPPSQERVERNKQTATELDAGGEYGKQQYLQKLSYVRSKSPAYQAAELAQRDISNKNMKQAFANINKALNIEPLEAQFYLHQQYNFALDKNPHWFQIYLRRGLNYAKQNKHSQARLDLEKSNSIVPTAIAMNQLGKIALDSGARSEAKSYFQAASEAAGQVGQEASLAFLKLDVIDNPARYIESTLLLDSNNNILVRLSNRVAINLSRITINLIHDRRIRIERTIGSLPAAKHMQLKTAIKVSEAEELGAYRVIIKSVVAG
jgi:predicted Zn-dependent protease